MLMMLISDRFLLFAFERERSYPKLFFIFLLAAVLAFLTDVPSSELDENTTASF